MERRAETCQGGEDLCPTIGDRRARADFLHATLCKGAVLMTTDILWFSELGLKDLDRVGGKNASLGEMVQNLTSAGVQVPDGFATTADAYRSFLADSGLD